MIEGSMLQHPVFTTRQTMEFNGYYAGYSFGRLYYRCNNTLDELQLLLMIGSLKPSRKFSAYWYRRGFYSAYYNSYEKEWQTCLPLKVKKEIRETIMGSLAKAQQRVQQQQKEQMGDWNGYVKAATLIKHKMTFCIRSISSSVGNYGPQWDLEIQLAENVLTVLGAPDGTTTAKLTIGKTPDGQKPTSKDVLLADLMERVPVHNCSLVSIPLQGGKSFIDFKGVPAPFNPDGHEICDACGEEIEEDEGVEELDDHPF